MFLGGIGLFCCNMGVLMWYGTVIVQGVRDEIEYK